MTRRATRGEPRVPQIQDLYESRDEQYEPGRRVRVRMVVGVSALVECTANPRRPDRVGSTTTIGHHTLATKWRLVETGGLPVGGEQA